MTIFVSCVISPFDIPESWRQRGPQQYLLRKTQDGRCEFAISVEEATNCLRERRNVIINGSNTLFQRSTCDATEFGTDMAQYLANKRWLAMAIPLIKEGGGKALLDYFLFKQVASDCLSTSHVAQLRWAALYCEVKVSFAESLLWAANAEAAQKSGHRNNFLGKLAYLNFLAGYCATELAECTYQILLERIESFIITPVDSSDEMDYLFCMLGTSDPPTATSTTFAGIFHLAMAILGLRYQARSFRSIMVSKAMSPPWPGAEELLGNIRLSIKKDFRSIRLLVHLTPAQANIFSEFLTESYQLWQPLQPYSLHGYQILLVWLAAYSFSIRSVEDWLKSLRGREMLSTLRRQFTARQTPPQLVCSLLAFVVEHYFSLRGLDGEEEGLSHQQALNELQTCVQERDIDQVSETSFEDMDLKL
ncbi:hypothetical protein CCUS01_06570 [Colletotrichum cuscutae]|uniref:Uncharacterized protein n=1 Tax=Colletotrichum cuscutae TaxID=1209917 RepID=A0AAI9V7H8_9PEZI|nr:hypothetical protein CCUS01_06570 [Colletotrichum cuscutae]